MSVKAEAVNWDDAGVNDYIDIADAHEEHIQAQDADQGGKLSPSQLEEQATALDVDYDKAIDHLKTDAVGYGDQYADEKANVALLTQLRLKASNFDEVSQKKSPEEVAQYNASIKNAALEGDGQKIRELIGENGGDVSKMSNDQLADLFDVNIHNYNHYLLANEAGPSGQNHFHTSHAFETNYASEDGYVENDPRHGGHGQHMPGDGSPQGTLAFYNDAGAQVEQDSNGTQHSLEAIIAETREVHKSFLDAMG
jgi:hypothetical protein